LQAVNRVGEHARDIICELHGKLELGSNVGYRASSGEFRGIRLGMGAQCWPEALAQVLGGFEQMLQAVFEGLDNGWDFAFGRSGGALVEWEFAVAGLAADRIESAEISCWIVVHGCFL
jgi:hypothetical protein